MKASAEAPILRSAQDDSHLREPSGSSTRSAMGRRELLPLALLVLCALIYHAPELFGGRIFSEADTRLFYFPLTDWFAEELRSGRLPFWLPTTFAGYPLLADGEVGPLYPLNLLTLPVLPVAT